MLSLREETTGIQEVLLEIKDHQLDLIWFLLLQWELEIEQETTAILVEVMSLLLQEQVCFLLVALLEEHHQEVLRTSV